MKHVLSILSLSFLSACGGGSDEPLTKFSYGTHPNQSAIVNEAKGPVVVFIHGGGWSGGSIENHHWLIDNLSLNGITGIAVGYRFLPDYKQQHQVADIKTALSFVEKQYPGKQIMVAGGSAGGYLAVQATAEYIQQTKTKNIQCIYNFAGPVDLSSDQFSVEAKNLIAQYTVDVGLDKANPMYYATSGAWDTLGVKWSATVSKYDTVVPYLSMKPFYDRIGGTIEIIDNVEGHAVPNSVVEESVLVAAKKCFGVE